MRIQFNIFQTFIVAEFEVPENERIFPKIFSVAEYEDFWKIDFEVFINSIYTYRQGLRQGGWLMIGLSTPRRSATRITSAIRQPR